MAQIRVDAAVRYGLKASAFVNEHDLQRVAIEMGDSTCDVSGAFALCLSVPEAEALVRDIQAAIAELPPLPSRSEG